MSSVVVIYFYAISGSGKKQSSAMVFTIYQSEYVSRANINHWMLAVSQINEIIAHNLQGEADVNRERYRIELPSYDFKFRKRSKFSSN